MPSNLHALTGSNGASVPGDLPAGKYRRLGRLCDARGRFAMLAIDQRGSLQRMIGERRGIPAVAVPGDDLRRVKRAVTAALAPFSTAVLTDPLYGYDATLDVIPARTGVLLSLEVTGYETAGEAERRSRLIEGWSVDAIQRAGADAVKVLVWHHPEASPATQRHQQALVRAVGEACGRAGMPFVLEVVTYRLGRGAGDAAFAREKPDRVVDAARTYADPAFGVDLLKIEFPADLRYAEEYQGHRFGRGEPVYDRAAVEAACRRLDDAAGMPWLILSAGVDPDEFAENVRLANAAGASGFLCGRAVWKGAVDHVGDAAAMRAYMEDSGRRYFEMICAANEAALPWHLHRRYRGLAEAPLPA